MRRKNIKDYAMNKIQNMIVWRGNRFGRSLAFCGLRRGVASWGALCLCTGLLLGGCGKETAEDAANGWTEIAARAALPVSATSEGVSVSGASTRAVADPSQEMTLWFARSDAINLSTYGSWQTPALKAVRAGGAGSQKLTFDPAQYYLTNEMWSRMVGWYPGGGVLPGGPDGYYDGTAVSWTIDGRQDILISGIVNGAKTKPILTHFAFKHALAQLRFHFYADSEAAVEQWGRILGVAIRGQRIAATFTLGNTSLDFSGDADQSFAAANFTELTPPVGTKDDAVSGGDPVMIEPQETPCPLTLEVTTEKRGVQTVVISERSYPAGQSVAIMIALSDQKIIVDCGECNIVPWYFGKEVMVESGHYPYTVDGRIIVLKDLFGQADEQTYPLHKTPWTKTPMHTEVEWNLNTSGYNTLGIRFQVAAKLAMDETGTTTYNGFYVRGEKRNDYNPSGITLCSLYYENEDKSDIGTWRSPTIQEAMLIARMWNELKIEKSTQWYWVSTKKLLQNNVISQFNIQYSSGKSAGLGGQNLRPTLCIRDLY